MAKEEKESTSVMIRPTVWKKAKIYAVKHDIQLSEFLELAIEKMVEK